MQIRKHRFLFLFLIVFLAGLFQSDCLLAHNANVKLACARHILKSKSDNTDNSNHSNKNDRLAGGYNPLQLSTYKPLRIEVSNRERSIYIPDHSPSLSYLKYTHKNISAEYARFLKLLLFPNHSFE